MTGPERTAGQHARTDPLSGGTPDRGLPVLGWKERAALPAWGIRRLRAKLDTGARSSALHVTGLEQIDEVTDASGTRALLRFTIVLGREPNALRRTVTAPALDWRTVRDTGANAELRPVVRTRVVCGPIDREVDVTLTDRTGMNFRIILGRTTLAGACLVDPDRGYLVTPAPPRRR